jgi:flagellin
MSLGVLNNISAIYAQNNLNQSQSSLQNVLTQLSSGSRINSGADDAAGLSIANGLAANSAALTQSSSNASAGVGYLQVADGALSQVTSLLNRAVTLATESAGGTLTSAQQSAADQEYQDILGQIDTIGSKTQYNGLGAFTSGTGAPTAVPTTSFNTPAAGAALTVTLTPGDTLSGYLGITSTAGTPGSTIINMGTYGGLTSQNQATATAAATSLAAALNAGLGATTGINYSATMNATTGVLTISQGSGVDVLSATSSSMTQAAPNVSSAVTIYTSDGTSTGSAGYTVTVGTLTRGNVGTTNGGNGENLTGTNLTTQALAETALTDVTSAIGDVAYQRGQVGANINTLTAASNIESAEQTNVVSAENNVTATDYASATSNMSKYEILTQTGISALAQANSTQQMVTKLLQ